MSPAAEKAADLLAPRCADCGEVVTATEEVANFGDLQYHLACRPRCEICRRRLEPGEGGWRAEGRVVSEPWGYGVRAERLWCPSCYGSAPRDEPKAAF